MTPETPTRSTSAQWVTNAQLLWSRRHLLLRVAICALLVSFSLSLCIHTRYESTTRIMPPDQQGGGAAMLATLLRSSTGNLAGLAGSLGGVRTTDGLLIDLLGSRTVSQRIIDRFHLQRVYHTHYLIDTMKKLARRTSITDDKKSGVITIVVEDTDRQRAQDMAQAYLDELNNLETRVNVSSAHLERIFIEQRLATVQSDLEQAQIDLSNFSSAHTAIDIKEQTRAMVDAGAKLQGELIAAQSELDSTEQIYGEENVRVRAARARIGLLQSELGKMSGSDASLTQTEETDASHPYPALRQLPQLGVQWADLYRRVRVQETVFDMLSAQHESARIEEAKDTPVVSVIDPPNWPEKKSYPPRLLIVLVIIVIAVLSASFLLLLQRSWQAVAASDPCKLLVQEMRSAVQRRMRFLVFWRGSR